MDIKTEAIINLINHLAEQAYRIGHLDGRLRLGRDTENLIECKQLACEYVKNIEKYTQTTTEL